MSLLDIATSIGSQIGGMAGGHQNERRNYRNERNLANQQYGNQRMLNRQGHDLQMDMWNKTNYGAQVDHMKDAGLNPALMYGSAGQGGQTGSQTGGSASKGSSSQGKVMDMSNMLLGAQIEGIKAKANSDNANADDIRNQSPGKVGKLGEEISNLKKSGNLIDENRLKTMKETEVREYERQIKEIDANWLKENGMSTMSVKEMKLIGEVMGSNAGKLVEMIDENVGKAVDFLGDPIGESKKIMNNAEEVVKEIFNYLQKKFKD